MSTNSNGKGHPTKVKEGTGKSEDDPHDLLCDGSSLMDELSPAHVELANKLLQGDRRALSRAITLVESSRAVDQSASERLLSYLLVKKPAVLGGLPDASKEKKTDEGEDDSGGIMKENTRSETRQGQKKDLSDKMILPRNKPTVR
tara:strand:- start:526 stop:960 length:435 start_codon:yes stop_codon:yes gene_type:complete